MNQTTRLENGIHIVTRNIPGLDSAALGVWLVNGSRHQTPEQSGYAHLLEHLLFKRTAQHDALALAQHFEAMGGRVNAHTGRELTALHGQVPAPDLSDLLELFCAMLMRSRFDASDLDVEREVVFQEMAMVQDSPEEALEEAAVAHAWEGHPLGWPILGCKEVLEQASAAALHDYLEGLLQGGRIYVVAAGGVDHEAVVRACAPLAALPSGTAPDGGAAPRFQSGTVRASRALAQQHLIWLMPTPSLLDPARPALLIANHVLGGGYSSRLFQHIRELRALAYTIESRLELYSDCGLWDIQTACDPPRTGECRRAVAAEVERLIHEGPTAAELERARRHLHAALLVEKDDPESVAERLAREAIYLGRHPDIAERVAQLNAVTAVAVQTALAVAWKEALLVEWGR